MIERDVIPTTEKRAFWALTRPERDGRDIYHVALIDILSGHALWSKTSAHRIDADLLAAITQRFHRDGWTIESYKD